MKYSIFTRIGICFCFEAFNVYTSGNLFSEIFNVSNISIFHIFRNCNFFKTFIFFKIFIFQFFLFYSKLPVFPKFSYFSNCNFFEIFFSLFQNFHFLQNVPLFFKIWVFDNFFSQYFSNLHFSQNILSFKIFILLNIVTFQKFHLSKSLYSFFRFSSSSMFIFYTIFKFVKI